MISALRLTLRVTDVGSRVTFLFAKRKVTKRNAPPSASRRAAHAGALRSSVRRGTARNSLRSDTRASSPSPDLRCSARYKTDSTSKATTAPRGSTPCVDAPASALPRNPFAAGTRAICPGSGGWGLQGCPRHGPEACLGRVGQNAQPRSCRLRRTAQTSKRGQAYTDVLAASPANPTRPTHPIIRFTLPTATPLQTPGHPACRPC
ncbi:hypothetical protein DFO63_3726 [Stenotrophomonas sp. AG209]|nr:hypothetical protein DFO63_3726 [Stenotrophomonas sp. AG209]